MKTLCALLAPAIVFYLWIWTTGSKEQKLAVGFAFQESCFLVGVKS
jgi:hypothetical protein